MLISLIARPVVVVSIVLRPTYIHRYHAVTWQAWTHVPGEPQAGVSRPERLRAAVLMDDCTYDSAEAVSPRIGLVD